jgi:hypothetical protein
LALELVGFGFIDGKYSELTETAFGTPSSVAFRKGPA